MAGYSPTPLFKKLGLKEGMQVKLIHAPANYWALMGDLAYKPIIEGAPPYDIVHLFTNSVQELKELLPDMMQQIKKNGIIWVSWYKLSAKKTTELTENVVRELALASGLVDVKVCAFDDDWSALKLVYRLKDR
jgi:Protein of unknown function (DUF3052)